MIRQGSALSASRRAAFLAAFAPPMPDPAAGAEDKALIGDIEDFRARVEAGEFRGEYSWDDHGYGDDSWVGEIDALFGAADTAFLSGHLTTAADAYRALFAILDLDDDGGLFGYGEECAADRVDTDLSETAVRYLRALYSSASNRKPDQRAALLLSAWIRDLPYDATPAGLEPLREALPTDLPDYPRFLPAWIETLRARQTSAPDPRVRRLLTAATREHGDPEPLARVAREATREQGAAYLEWISELLRLDRPAEAEDAARQGLTVLDPHDPTRAQVADHLAELAATRADHAAELDAREQAWDAAATGDRAVTLFLAARANDRVAPVLDRAVENLRTKNTRHGGNAELHVDLLLFRDRVTQAADIAAKPHEPWQDPALAVLPYLSTAGSAAWKHPRWEHSLLRRLLLGDEDRSGRAHRRWALEGEPADPHSMEPAAALRPSRGAVLFELVQERAVTEAGRTVLLQRARTLTDQVLAGTVGAKHQSRYGHAARLSVALAEAEVFAGAGFDYYTRAKERYPRHSAFHRELAAARKTSAFPGSAPEGEPPSRGAGRRAKR